MGAVNLHRVGIDRADRRAQLVQNGAKQMHVGDLGDVFNAADSLHQKCGGKDGNSRVFRAADLHLAKQGLAAPNDIFCQTQNPLFYVKTDRLCSLYPQMGLPYRKQGPK
ncbi:hypothetical protein SDC9_157003 [bioreactor metagenome]|uniref:Uncharacterized protein n=1 Tax=bioreactor metagenome TaxID=1076179 RepID=A0A645F620_9ZZZZ